MKWTGRTLQLLALSLGAATQLWAEAAETPASEADFDKLALDFISGHLAARPFQGVALGFHQYDGKIGDYSRLAIDAEVERLQRFQAQLGKLNASQLSKTAEIDRRILLAAIAGQLFQIQDMGIFEKNPMIYARALDLNTYLKRDFKPLEDRMRDIVTIEDQAANVMTAAKTNLAAVLPKPYVELGIQVANGSADFLEKDLAAALKDVKDEQLTAAFQDANKKAVASLRDFAGWLTKEKLPKASADFAIGAVKYERMLTGTELVDLAPEKVLALGLQRLKEEQDVFAVMDDDFGDLHLGPPNLELSVENVGKVSHDNRDDLFDDNGFFCEFP